MLVNLDSWIRSVDLRNVFGLSFDSCLKAKEVDQKNQSKGLELFVVDGIPLNENFLSLKSKYNSDYASLKEEYEKLCEMVRSHDVKNRSLGAKISALRRDYKYDCEQLHRKQL